MEPWFHVYVPVNDITASRDVLHGHAASRGSDQRITARMAERKETRRMAKAILYIHTYSPRPCRILDHTPHRFTCNHNPHQWYLPVHEQAMHSTSDD